MTVYVAADHAGFALKEALKPFLLGLGHHVVDCGAASLDLSDDYPDMVKPCAMQVAADPSSFGIVIGASGQGEAMVANRTPGIRAAVYYGDVTGKQLDADGASYDLLASARVHNNANVLSLGARFMSEEQAKDAVVRFLETPYAGEERHARRIAKF